MTHDTRPIAVLFGTRPEAIKLAPVILELRRRDVPLRVIATGQHRELVAAILRSFEIEVDEDLDLMLPEQSLDHILATALTRIGDAIDRHPPRAVVVQGDTTSALAAALSTFHRKIPLAHVEAGLRSGRMDLPFPEEMNRRAISMVACWHFAPTNEAANNLRQEGITAGVTVTGNTVVDALRHIVATEPGLPDDVVRFVADHRFVLATAHRRESWAGGISEIARGLAEVLALEPELRLVFVTHPNPVAREPVEALLGANVRALVLSALDYPAFLELLRRCAVAVSDSGGVQEEGPTLGIPVLVTRQVTERPEGVQAGAVRLVGTNAGVIRDTTLEILRDDLLRERMSSAGRTVYGDGDAARRIADRLLGEVPC